MIKYVFFANYFGVSDPFDTKEECVRVAKDTCQIYGNEVTVYSYDTDEVNEEELEIDDCNYEEFITLDGVFVKEK